MSDRDDLKRRVANLEGYVTELQRRTARGRARAVRERLLPIVRPRLGKLDQHRPRPLRVPRRYLRERPPADAPAVSLVTPSYNQAAFVERTIQSVLGQDYPALEYVVQDGGSDDGTTRVLERYTPRLSAWRSEPDSGQAQAINRGFAGTEGELMAWLNSDDLLLPGTLAYVARYFARHPDVDVVYGQRMLIDQDDRQVGVWITPRHDPKALELVDCVPQETLFWRRSAWEAAGGGLDEDLCYAIDWDLLLRLAESGARIVRLPRFLGAFRVHPEQKTTSDYPHGAREIGRLRERVQGRPMSDDEAWDLIGPYLRRHVLKHNLYRAGARLPLPRSDVAAWLDA